MAQRQPHEERTRAAESRARVAEAEESKAKAALAASKGKRESSGRRSVLTREIVEHAGTEPGFNSAVTVLLAMGVLYVIVSGLGTRIGAAWRTLLFGGGGSATNASVTAAPFSLPPLPKLPSLSSVPGVPGSIWHRPAVPA